MTTKEAIEHVDKLIDWFVEGAAPESEARLNEDIDALEQLKVVAERLQDKFELISAHRSLMGWTNLRVENLLLEIGEEVKHTS